MILTVVDPDAQEPTRNIGIADIKDGTATTVAYGEKRDSFGWAVGGWGGTEFDVNSSIAYEGEDAGSAVPSPARITPRGSTSRFADGSVRFAKSSVDRKLWYGMTTRAGGENILGEVMKLGK